MGCFLTWDYGVLAIAILVNTIITSFVIVSFRETKLKNKIAFLVNKKEVFQKEIQLINRNFEGLDEGKKFIIPNHNYSHDLDVFGYKSLFQFLNRTSTFKGKELLGNWLNKPLTNSEKIKEKQKAVKELAQKAEWGYELLAFGKASNDKADTQQTINNWLKDKPFLSNTLITIIKFLLPLTTITTGICAFLELVPTVISQYYS